MDDNQRPAREKPARKEEDTSALASGTVDFANAFAPTIELVPEDDGSMTDDRVHVQAAQDRTACGLTVGTVRLCDVGGTVNCSECIAWMDEEETVTPPRGTPMILTVEATLEINPVVFSLQITLPDGKQHRVAIPQSILDVVQVMHGVEDPRRMSWTLPVQSSDNQAEPSKE